MKKTLRLAAICGALMAVSTGASATPFVIGADLNDGIDQSNNLSYNGSSPNQYVGSIGDGGHDGFDTFGYWIPQTGISVHRQVDVLQGSNTYRWVDTLTNDSGAHFTGTARFQGNLGSDGSETFGPSTPFSTISLQGAATSTWDPVFGFVWGNNSWATGNMTLTRHYDNVMSDVALNLGIGESITLAHFATLMRPDDPNYQLSSSGLMYGGTTYDAAPIIADVSLWADDMIANPLFQDLNPSLVNSIVNFNPGSLTGGTVPAPGTLALAGLGLLGLGMQRRKWSKRNA